MPARFSRPPLRSLLQIAVAVLMILTVPRGSWADHITTKDGQSLEGLIRDENRFYISLDVRGVIIPIPRERIKEVTHASLDDNARALLDRAQEARSRDDLITARTLIEQARALNSHDTAIIATLRQQDKDLTDLEKLGGTQEARRASSVVLMQRARDAYDKVRIEEGDSLLLQALKTDPTNPDAQKEMFHLLTTRKNIDPEMAANYFNDAVWPDHVTEDNPVIAMLPQIYAELATQFDVSTDMPQAQHIAELMQTIYAAFQKHADWKTSKEVSVREILNEPLNQLLSTLVENNLRRGTPEYALEKLNGWGDPTASPEMALLFARAEVGVNDYEKAAETLQKAIAAFPDDTRLVPHMNALNLMVSAKQAQKQGNVAEALTNYEKVFALRDSLVPEIGKSVGEQLADIRYRELEAIPANAPPPAGYQAADTAAQVLMYSSNGARQHRAAEVLAATLPRVPWHLELAISVNGSPVTFDPSLKKAAETSLEKPFSVTFDDNSPFLLQVGIDFGVGQTSTTQAISAVSAGSAGIPVPLLVSGLGFGVVASHPSLGALLKFRWAETSLPVSVKTRHDAAGAPPMAYGKPLFWVLQKPDSLSQFVQTELPDYMLNRIGLLNSRITVAKVQALLGPQAIH